jgi:hypothetical protein
LALSIHDLFDGVEQVGKTRFGRFSPAHGEPITAGDTCVKFAGSFADCLSVPPEFSLCQSLSAGAELLDGACHEETFMAACECLGSFDEERFETFGEFHDSAPASDKASIR